MLPRRISPLLLLGDFLVVLALSVGGFLFHNEGFSWRLLSTLVPSLVSWVLIAPWLGLYRPEISALPSQAWRAALAGLLAAPFAAFLRGLWLNSAILPLFVAVLSGTTALGMGLWRLAWSASVRRTSSHG